VDKYVEQCLQTTLKMYTTNVVRTQSFRYLRFAPNHYTITVHDGSVIP